MFSFGAGGKSSRFWNSPIGVHLAAALERAHALPRGARLVAVEVGGALLELREVLDALQGALRSEQTLDADAAQRRRVDAVPVLVRPDVADGMRRRVRVAVGMAVEAGDALGRLHALADPRSG